MTRHVPTEHFSRICYKCPSSTAYAGSAVPGRDANGNNDNSYQINGVLVNRHSAIIPNAAEIIWVQEYIWFSNTAWIRPYYRDDLSPVGYVEWLNSNYDSLHFEGGNLLFCDGHVKWRKQSRIAATEFGINDSSVGVVSGTTDSSTAQKPALF